jgi:uncharacterized membrane protein YcaP (DUF421 family)
LLRVLAHTITILAFLVLGFRTIGRRALAQLSVIDFVVILLLGSAVETSMVAGDTSLVAGLVCAGTLFAANRALVVVLRRSSRLRYVVAGSPILLVNDGQVIAGHLRRAGITPADLQEALRQRGEEGASHLHQVILEADGTIHVIPAKGPGTSFPSS